MLAQAHDVELALRDVVAKFALVDGGRQPVCVVRVIQVGHVIRGEGRAVAVVQIEALEVLLEEFVLRQTIVAHPPVRRDRSVEYVEWHLLRIDAQVRRHKCRDGHVLARAAKALIITRVLRFVQLIRHRIQAF